MCLPVAGSKNAALHIKYTGLVQYGGIIGLGIYFRIVNGRIPGHGRIIGIAGGVKKKDIYI